MTSVLPLDLIATFDSLLRDDPSAENLLIWADALEDEGDEACRGVREFLVGRNRLPGPFRVTTRHRMAKWFGAELATKHWWIPRGIVERFRLYSDKTGRSRFYDQNLLGDHYYTIALYDAAQAWCTMNPPEKSSK